VSVPFFASHVSCYGGDLGSCGEEVVLGRGSAEEHATMEDG
jgi:hypothetical protein